jgi:hypothetical protein
MMCKDAGIFGGLIQTSMGHAGGWGGPAGNRPGPIAAAKALTPPREAWFVLSD